MKKKITAITLLFIIMFSNTVFAKPFPSMDNVKPNKIWVIKFNKNIKSVATSIKNKNNEYVSHVMDIEDNKITITALMDYEEGEYLLEIKEAKAVDGSVLKEAVDMKFTIKK